MGDEKHIFMDMKYVIAVIVVCAPVPKMENISRFSTMMEIMLNGIGATGALATQMISFSANFQLILRLWHEINRLTLSHPLRLMPCFYTCVQVFFQAQHEEGEFLLPKMILPAIPDFFCFLLSSSSIILNTPTARA